MTATINTSATVARARQLLHAAADASKQLEESVRELVAMRAWEVLGYEDFSEMWEKENGFPCPTLVQVLAVDALRREGMNSLRGRYANPPNGHTRSSVAEAVGIRSKSTIDGMLAQLSHGVSPTHVVKAGGTSGRTTKDVIDAHGAMPYAPRARGQQRRQGAAPDDLVGLSSNVPRRLDDEIGEIARKADVPKAEIVRQALEEYAARYRESRPAVAS